MRTAFLLCWLPVGVAAGIGFALSTELAAGAQRPNLVLIAIDNLGFRDTGCYGNREIKTPHIDRLAAEGVRCTNFYSASPTCTVSRASFLTGRYPQRHGLVKQLTTRVGLKVDENLGPGLRQTEQLIPQFLKPQGYATACVGKWNIGFAPGSRPTERGFDEFLGNASGNMDYYTHVYKGRNDMYRGTEPEPNQGRYSTDLYADTACDFIRRKAGQPFFLYLAFNAVHYNNPTNTAPGVECVWQAPDEAFAAYGYSPQTRDEKQRYDATVTALDTGVGRVLGQLNSLGLAKNTLVILFSDNGAFKAQIEYASNAPFRTETEMIYEGSLRVMAIARWPGRLAPGRVCDELLISLDFFPMILAAAGAPLPTDRTIDGRDPTAVLAGESPSRHLELFWDYSGSKAVRRGQHKLVLPRKRAPELYDLTSDPSETTNLAATSPDVVQQLQQSLCDWAGRVRDP